MSRLIEKFYSRVYKERKLLSVTAIITERCHLQCDHCYLKKPAPELTVGEWSDILAELKDAGASSILITGGEPMLRPDIFELLSEVKRLGYHSIIMNTTATPCNRERSERLKASGLKKASVSLYSLTPEIHDRITGVKGSLKKTLQGIKNLLRAGISVEAKCLQMRENLGEAVKVLNWCKENGVSFRYNFSVTSKHDGNSLTKRHSPSAEILAGELVKLAEADPRFAPRPKANSSCGTKTCGFAKVTVEIAPYGRVYPCLEYNIPLGNIRRESFRRLWNSQKALELSQIKHFSHPTCRQCPDRDFCNFCPAISQLESGSPDAPNDVICKAARVRHLAYLQLNSEEYNKAAAG